jgi:hypothetical protein
MRFFPEIPFALFLHCALFLCASCGDSRPEHELGAPYRPGMTGRLQVDDADGLPIRNPRWFNPILFI